MRPMLALTEAQEAVRDFLQKGGSTLGVVLTLLCLLAIVVVTYALSEMLSRYRASREHFENPKKLFHDLLHSLNLANYQRKFLHNLASRQALAQPATLLVSRQVYDKCVESLSRSRNALTADERRVAAEIRNLLFPPTQ
jgi:hypothetical protein